VFAPKTSISLVFGLDGLGSTVAMGTSDDGLKSFRELDGVTELVEVTDELKNAGLVGVELEMLELEMLELVVPGLDTMLDCRIGVVIGELLVVGVFIVGAVVRST
jgi:hypothetical protein